MDEQVVLECREASHLRDKEKHSAKEAKRVVEDFSFQRDKPSLSFK